jgi:2-hydroxy-6-oxonona-2,4-dienedioate hydrolase
MNPQRVRFEDHFAWPEFVRDFGVDIPSPLQSEWTNVNGLRLHSRGSARADGPRFLLVHGMVISSLYMIPLAERLADAGFEAHAVDLPGYGRSQKPDAPLDVPALADSIRGWIAARGGGAWHLVGNSFGCQVVADLAVRHPSLVETAALIGMTIDPAAPSLFRQTLRLLRDMPREPLRLWLNHIVDYLRAGPRFAVGAMRSMMADRIETKLPRIEAPTLVIRGEHDPVTPRRWTSEAMSLLRRGSFVEIPNGSHAVHYAAPESVCDAIKSFVASPFPAVTS